MVMCSIFPLALNDDQINQDQEDASNTFFHIPHCYLRLLYSHLHAGQFSLRPRRPR
jgi:hypothetical protein